MSENSTLIFDLRGVTSKSRLGECSRSLTNVQSPAWPCFRWGIRTNGDRAVTAAVSFRSITPLSARPTSQPVQSGAAGGTASVQQTGSVLVNAAHVN